MSWFRKNSVLLFTVSSCLLAFSYVGYFLNRADFNQLLCSWVVLCIGYYYLMTKNIENGNLLLSLSVLFRLLFLFSIPTLSQDFYRFIWDGRLVLHGLNPYLSVPESFIQSNLNPIADAQNLYEGMGVLNGSNFTNYPPLNQLNFTIAAFLGNNNLLWTIVFLRLQIILADLGIIFYGRKILKKLNINPNQIFWYALNPLVIIELTGNLHFEAVMLFFMTLSFYHLIQHKWVWSALCLASAVSIKLIPLLLLPLIFQWFQHFSKHGLRNYFVFAFLVILINVILFLPFLSPNLISNYTSSVGLWFRNFEFNASFYYLFREIGYWFRGYNEIAIIGKIVPILTILLLGYLSLVKKVQTIQELFVIFLLGFTIYYLLTTTVHPWYLATLVLLSCFSTKKYPIVWSVVAIASYQVYQTEPYKENLLLITLEYFILGSFMLYEYLKKESA